MSAAFIDKVASFCESDETTLGTPVTLLPFSHDSTAFSSNFP